ncbi:MAG TPA: hypothetical protein VFB72_17950 [Verrucomicrobiae bacterium]|nr:hypothetical protein [Verrucomicrobiae bacterium]
MNPHKNHRVAFLVGLALAAGILSFGTTARANVYATDIQINGALTGTANVSVGSPVTITYHLNDNATGGVTVKILNGNAVVASFAGTTTMGLNTVSWTPTSSGIYSVSITAASTGYPTWQQISPLTPNYTAVFPLGMAVDKNANSPYYGRVVLGCGIQATQHGVTQNCGFYKFNADGSAADEGAFGDAGYTTNDADVTASGQMPATTRAGFFQWRNPSTIRIGEDDRIYWMDNSDGGAIAACDMQASTNQVIICSQNCPTVDFPSYLVGPNYANSPADGQVNQTTYGWIQFDILNTGTASSYTGTNGIYTGGQAAVFMNDWDYPCAGVWMWHLVGTPGSMTVDPTDTYGQQVVSVGSGADSLPLRSDGVAVDNNLDIFVGESRSNGGDPAPRTAGWTSWNGGVLPPGDQGGAQGGGFNYSLTGGALWTEGGGSSSPSDANVFDVVLNSKTNPTLLARAHDGSGIDLLVPLNPTIALTGASLSGTTLTINCVSSSPYAPVASQLYLIGSSTVNGTYSPVTATFTGSNGVFQATTTISGPTGFYQVTCPSTAGTSVMGSAVTITGSGPVTNTLSGIDNTDIYYSGIAFDNVGNLYGANVSDNYWRVWSPPGPNTNTTVAVAKVGVISSH